MLYKRNRNGSYDDVAEGAGLTDGGWSWNAKFGDLDNDGWQDLFIAAGDPSVQNYHPFSCTGTQE
nr:FG-GAP-like repeat-containing protein [Sphingopyxis sp. BSNA05]